MIQGKNKEEVFKRGVVTGLAFCVAQEIVAASKDDELAIDGLEDTPENIKKVVWGRVSYVLGLIGARDITDSEEHTAIETIDAMLKKLRPLISKLEERKAECAQREGMR
jgi:hypothetical protein